MTDSLRTIIHYRQDVKKNMKKQKENEQNAKHLGGLR
jgi:hypothetical protein